MIIELQEEMQDEWVKGGRTAHLSKATVTSCGHILLKYFKVCAHFSSGSEEAKEKREPVEAVCGM